MVGYGKDGRSYRIYNPHNRRNTESRNVNFIETPPRNLTKNKIDTSLAENEAEEDTAYEEDVLDHLSLIQSSSNGDKFLVKAISQPVGRGSQERTIARSRRSK